MKKEAPLKIHGANKRLSIKTKAPLQTQVAKKTSDEKKVPS
jgi:hypothetical protein